MKSTSRRFTLLFVALLCLAAALDRAPASEGDSSTTALPNGVGAEYLALSNAIRTKTMPDFMKIFHFDYIFEAIDASSLDRGPWRRLWLERFEETSYDTVAFDLVRVVEKSDAEIILRVRRVVVKGKDGSFERQLQEAVLEDTWVKSDAGAWTLIFRKEIEIRTDGALATAQGAEIRSPRIAALAKDLRAGKKTSLSAFWSEIEKSGSPLVERVPDSKKDLVSFLWRGRGGESRVRLEGGRPTTANLKSLTRLGDTNLWYRTERLATDARFTYEFHVEKKVSVPASGKDPAGSLFVASTSADPLNKKSVDERSLVELAGAPPLTILDRIDDRPSGDVERQRLTSEALGEARFVSVYTPPDYDEKGAPYKAAFLIDRGSYSSRRATRVVLDNLIAEKKIPPVVVFLIHSEGSQREDLEISGEFLLFFGEELVAWAREGYHVSEEPRDNVIGGNGIGATLAASVASRHSDVFGSVLAESGNFSGFSAAKGKVGGSIARRFSKKPTQPLRFHLSVADLEDRLVVRSNQHLRDVLEAKGYDVTYARIAGNHNSRTWNGALASGLEALLGK
jgi:enterochelin esterase family protein